MEEQPTIPQALQAITPNMEARPFQHKEIHAIHGIPAAPLQRIRDKIEPEWWDHDSRHILYRNHAKTRCIRLRHVTDYDFNNIRLTDFPEKRETFEPEITELLSLLSSHYEFCDFTAILLLLPPGATIKPHVDQGRWFRLAHRIHIPIQTNSDVIFSVGTTSVAMQVGIAYEIDNANQIHSVCNNGEINRIHLVVDLLPLSSLLNYPF